MKKAIESLRKEIERKKPRRFRYLAEQLLQFIESSKRELDVEPTYEIDKYIAYLRLIIRLYGLSKFIKAYKIGNKVRLVRFS